MSEPLHKGDWGLRSVLPGVAVLGAVLMLVAACTSVYTAGRYGSGSIVACFLAAVICWISASAALAITALTTGGPQAVAGLFLAIGVRMGPPLFAGVTQLIVGGQPAESGLFGLIVVHYLVALIVETCFAVRLVAARSQVSR